MPRGVYLILGAQAGAIYKKEAFKNSFILITVASSTKQICFQQKYQESLKKVE